MVPKLGSQLLSLPHIFSGNFFNIPDYQRGFSWESEQVKDLLADIDHLLLTPGQARHFTGTLVVSKVDGETRFDIVDGQQRLTTVVILMRCLYDALTDRTTAERVTETYLRRGPLGNEKWVLQLGVDSQEFFSRVVLGNDSSAQFKATLAAHVKLEEARKAIEKWLKEKAVSFAEAILPVIEERLGLLVYNPVDSSEVGIMFEVINNRGKELSELEKVKNYLIYAATKLNAPSTREKVNQRWSSILKNLHIANHTTAQDEGGFLRAVSVIHLALNKSDSSYVHYMLRTKFLKIDEVLQTLESRRTAIGLIESFVETMDKSSYWYAVLHGQQYGNLDKALVFVLERLRAQNQHANIMPVFLAVMIRHGGQPGADGVLQRLLGLIEKVNFRVYMSRGIIPRTDSGQAWLYGIASNYFNKKETYALEASEADQTNALDRQLEHELVYFCLYYARDERLKKSLKLDEADQFDFYKWRGLKYFLMCYEASLKESKTVKIDNILNAVSGGKSGDYYSVEHIWATKHDEDTYNRPRDKHVRRRLGNFMLLELNLNIAGSNHDIRTKIDIYTGMEVEGIEDGALGRQPSEMAQVRELIRDARKEIKKIDANVFDDRRCKPYLDLHINISDRLEARYLKFAVKQWSLESYQGYKEALKALVQGDEPVEE